MKVIAVAEYGNDFPVAVVKLQDTLDPEFAKEARGLYGWKDATSQTLLEAQTFVAWFRKQLGRSHQTIQNCLDNEQYAWSDTLEIQEV